MPSSKIHRPQPIKSWTEKSAKVYDKGKDGGATSSPRGLYSKRKSTIPVNDTVGGEWELQACQELTSWANRILKRHKQRQITDLKKALADGTALVNLLQALFNHEIDGVQTRPIIRAQRLENIHLCLRFLQTRGIDIQGLDSQEIADSNLRVGLLLMTRLQKRFENKHTTSGFSQLTNGSFHKGSGADQLNNNDFHPLAREGSIHSSNSGSTNPGMLPDLGNSYDSSSYRQFMRTNSISEKPETLLPGGAFESDEEGVEATPPKIGEFVSTTELDPGGVLQHKYGDSQIRQPQDVSLDIEMANMFLDEEEGNGPTNFTSNGPGVQSSVEERLKSLLEMPNPGGYNDSGDIQDEGEMLELPPPDVDVLAEGRGGSEEEDRLQAILEDPDNFDDYPQDWDRYVSDYVPSHAAAKKEGPRAQGMLDKSSSPAQQLQEPFFHGPPREHLGPSQGNPAGPLIPDYRHRSTIEPLPSHLNQAGNMAGVVYSEQESYHSGQEAPLPNGSYHERRLPTYQAHMQMRLGGVMSPGTSPHSSGYDSRGHVSPGTSFHGPGQQNIRSPPDIAYHTQPESVQHQYYNHSPGDGLLGRMNDYQDDGQGGHLNSTYPQQGQHIHGVIEGHAHPHNNRRFSTMDQGHPRQPFRYDSNRPSSWSKDRRQDALQGGPPQFDRPPSSRSSSVNRSHHPPPTQGSSATFPHHPPWPDRRMDEESSDFTQDLNFYSGSSSRSSTPPLPAMSPPVTPPETPDIPQWRCASADIRPAPRGLGHSPRKGSRRSRDSTRGRRSAERAKVPLARSLSEPKAAVKKMSGRKRTKKRSPDIKQSRALAYLPLQRVSERTEDSLSETSTGYEKTERPRSNKSGSQMPGMDTTPQAGRDDEIDKLRGQLLSLESMYKEMLKTVGAEKGPDGTPKATPRTTPRVVRAVPVTKTGSKFKVNTNKIVVKQREKDVRAVNKRFSRVESHVVTLAKSVSSLSSQLRSQSALIGEIEEIRDELELLRTELPQGHLRPMTIPLAANPVSVKKLTKFFGEEPPLLTLFLTEMGYDKYVSAFDEAGVGFQELPYLTEDNLEQLGIPMGPRARILQEVQLMV